MKCIILIIDGMADRPTKENDYKTPLQAAKTPNMDKIAEEGINGIMDPISPGIRVGSDTAHLSILGYDPYKVYTGRGPFEAAGVGVDVKPGDIAFRCNFATVDENFVVLDRRADRIREGTDKLAETINSMKLEEDVEIIFKESTGHRAVLVLRGENLSDKITDADPKVENKRVKDVKPLDDSFEAKFTASILNKFVKNSYKLLEKHPINLKRIKEGKKPANIILPRGGGKVPSLENFCEKYNLKAACIAETGLIMGIARLAGMDVIEVPTATGGTDTDLNSIVKTILSTLDKYDFLLVNIDGADEAGHDGNFEEKKEFIERIDEVVISKILNCEDICLVLTADHTTPVSVKDHTGDPVPIVIRCPGVRIDDVKRFDEISASKGGLGRIKGSDIMNIILDLTNRSEKFGA